MKETPEKQHKIPESDEEKSLMTQENDEEAEKNENFFINDFKKLLGCG